MTSFFVIAITVWLFTISVLLPLF